MMDLDEQIGQGPWPRGMRPSGSSFTAVGETEARGGQAAISQMMGRRKEKRPHLYAIITLFL